MATPDDWEPYRQAARERYGRLSSFRLGVMVGEARAGLGAPPSMNARNREHYEAGVHYAQAPAARTLHT